MIYNSKRVLRVGYYEPKRRGSRVNLNKSGTHAEMANHREAVRRTVEEFNKDKVGRNKIVAGYVDALLKFHGRLAYYMTKHVLPWIKDMHTEGSYIRTPFGVLRVSSLGVAYNMWLNKRLTDDEWNYIRHEICPGPFDGFFNKRVREKYYHEAACKKAKDLGREVW